MSIKVSRRQFLQRAGCVVIGTTAFAYIGNGQTLGQASNVVEPAQVLTTAGIETWLLNTGRDEVDPELYTLLTSSAPLNHKIFLPTVQQ